MAASAFPTHSPSASTIRKSFFDASAIGTISGNAIVAVYPITERKGKARNCFVSVHMTLFEVHKTQKDAKNKKAAKYLVDFADVFNVSLQNEPVQIKEDCICVMDPSTSYFIRPIDSDYDLQAWFDWILERSRECRCTKLLRPVFREEFFEAAWDVRIIYRPKLRRDFGKKQQNETQIEDLAEKKPQMLGHHRLCICPSSFLLFDIGCRPSPSIDRPFEKCSFIDLSLNVISNYGTQEKFFFVRIGRCSEIGSGELWMATEHGAAAKAMHERISQINQRESERRRVQGIKINLPTISSSVLKSRAHRERSQTQNMNKNGQKRAAANAEMGVGQSTPEAELRKVSHNSAKDEPHGKQQNYQSNDGFSQHSSQSQLDARSHQSGGGRVDSFSCLQSIPERCLLGDQQQPGNPAAKKNSIVGLFASRIGAKMSSGSCGGSKSMSTEVKMDQLTAPSSPLANTGAKTFDLDKKGMFKEGSNNSLVNFAASSNQTARNSLVSSVFGLRLTRRNSLTGSRNQNQTAQQKPSQQAAATSSCTPFSAQPSYDCAEDYMTYDADDRCANANHTMKLDSVGSRVSATNMLARTGSRKSNSSAYSAAPMRQFSTSSGVGSSSASDPTNARSCQPSAATTYGDYLMMDKGQNPTNAEPVFALHEVQSYISNSSESCCTPGSNNTTTTQSVGELGSAANAPRAYSLGSRPGCTDSATNCRPASSGVGRMPTIPHSQQLLHPCANGSSPPNYLKKSILSKTAKSIKSKQQQAAANGNNNLEEKQEPEPLDDDEQNSHEKKEAADLASAELRKRAHSVGSKTWFNPSMRQLSTTEILAKRDENLVPPFPAADEDNNSRRNTGGAKSMGSGSSCYPHSMEDHALVDFTRDESPSIDSIPSLHSRNSSVGMQCPMGVRSALDSLSHSRGFGCGSPLAHCSDKSAEKQPGKSQQQQQDGNGIQQMKRKRSVPEMLQVHHHSNQQEGGNSSLSNSEQQHHPNRRSTMDSSAVRLRNQNQQRQHRKSPPRHQAMAGGGPIPASQSTSSGISSRTDSMTASSTTTAESHKHCAGAKEVGQIVEDQNQNADADDDDDYVMLNTPSSSSRQQKDGSHSQQQQKLTVRSIGTILESSSPNSSLSSDGENKKPGKMKSREKASSSMSSNPAAFSDDYSLLMMTADDQQGQQPFASQSPPTSKDIANATTATTTSPTRAQLSASFSKRRSPSLSPNLSQQQRKMSVQEYQQQPNPARSYFPVREEADGDPSSSSSASSRRTTSTTADYARERQQQQREKSPRKFTCPNLGQQQQQGRTTATRRMERQKATREEELGKEEECDYALIAEQPK